HYSLVIAFGPKVDFVTLVISVDCSNMKWFCLRNIRRFCLSAQPNGSIGWALLARSEVTLPKRRLLSSRDTLRSRLEEHVKAPSRGLGFRSERGFHQKIEVNYLYRRYFEGDRGGVSRVYRGGIKSHLNVVRIKTARINVNTTLMKNKVDLDTMSMDDLYNNLKMYESEVKGMSISNSNIQNMDFLSSTNSNTNGSVNTAQAVNTPNGVSTASTQVHAAFSINSNNLSDAVICAFLMEEIDLRWQMAMLTMRDRRFLKKTGRKLTVNGNETLGFDMSKVKCYNCHKRGHFARECKDLRNQANNHKESTIRSVSVETPAFTALVSCDGLGGYDFSDRTKEGPNYALMAYTSSSYNSKLKSFEFDKIQAMFDKAFKRVNIFEDFRTELVEGSSKRAREEITQESVKKQKVDNDKETTELKRLMKIIPDEEKVAIDAIPLAVKSLKIVEWKIDKEGKKNYYQIIIADEKTKMYMIFNRMLKEFDIEDLKDLYNLVKAKYGSTKPVEELDLLLWGDLKTMFESHIEDQVWKKQHGYRVLEWKLYDFCGVHSLRMQSVHIYLLVEKKYPLTAPTLTDMLNKKLQADHFTEMA
nr:hypothetical protein [Tanacetum cinerariifolium]